MIHLCHYLLLGQKVGMLLVRRRHQDTVLPELGTQVSVRAAERIKDGHDKVTHGTRVSTRRRVAISDTSHVQELLSCGRRDQTSTTGGRNETDATRTALARDLAGDSVGHAVDTAPVSTTDGGNVELGSGNGTTNGVSDFRRALDTETNVSLSVSDSDKGLVKSLLGIHSEYFLTV